MVNPVDTLGVPIGEVHGGTGHNTIPTEVVMKGSVRSVSNEGRARALEGLPGVARASIHGVSCRVDVVGGEPPLRCSQELTDIAADVIRRVAGDG